MESGKGDDPCVTFESPYEFCASFTKEQLIKIKHRKRYVKKQKKDTTSSKDDELDLLGDEDVESFTGSQADLESAAANLFASPPHPQPLPFESLSLKMPAKSVPPTPGTALQQKIESKLEKSLGNTLNIHLQQQMGSFQASMLEAFQSLRDEFTSFQKMSKKQVEVDQTSASASKPGPSNQAVNLDLPPPRPRPTSHSVEEMEVDYGPALPPRLGADHHNALDQHSGLSEEPSKKAPDRPKNHSHPHKRHDIELRSASDQYTDESDEPRISSSKPKKHADKSKHKLRSRHVSSSSEEDQSSAPRHRSSKPSGALSDQDQPQHDPDPPYCREVALSDVPSQYAEEVDTFRRILSLPDPRESMPRSSTSVMGLEEKKGRQELRPRVPSSMLPLSSVIKDAFDKFEHDFQAANLPEGKYIKPPPSTAKWYKVGQPCYEEKIQELNTDFAKICITPKPPGAPMGKIPLPILKELEHQARQNIYTLNFTAAFAKTSSSCDATLDKCQHSLKSTFKKVKSQIQKGANPERAAKCGYEQACEYLDTWNKTVLIQHRALTCLSKYLTPIYSRGSSILWVTLACLRRVAEMTLLQPHLGETRRQALRNSPFWHSSLFKSQLVKEGEDFLLKKGTSKDSQSFGPYQNKPFCGPHNKKRSSNRKRPYGGNSSQSINQSFSSGRGKPNFRGSRGHFRPHARGREHGNPSPQ